jgi:hypothetical protein
MAPYTDFLSLTFLTPLSVEVVLFLNPRLIRDVHISMLCTGPSKTAFLKIPKSGPLLVMQSVEI